MFRNKETRSLSVPHRTQCTSKSFLPQRSIINRGRTCVQMFNQSFSAAEFGIDSLFCDWAVQGNATWSSRVSGSFAVVITWSEQLVFGAPALSLSFPIAPTSSRALGRGEAQLHESQSRRFRA